MMQPDSPSNNNIAVCAIFKNEAPYILEWIAHHKSIGIEHYYIADNISTDGSSELLKKLNDDGIIHRLEWPTEPGVKPQLPAYNKLAELARNDGVTWAFFIDADEFIKLINGYCDVSSAIEPIIRNDPLIGGVAINWATYGSSGIILNPTRNIIQNFDHRFKKDSNINRHYKSLVNLNHFISSGSTPHEFKIENGYKYINSIGIELSQPLSGISESVEWGNIRLNHYMIKSKSEYVAKKMNKGRASSNTVLDMKYFHGADVNDEFDPFERRWIETVLSEKNTLSNKYALIQEDGNPNILYFKKESGYIGHIDVVKIITHNTIKISGWAIGCNGLLPHHFRVIANEFLELDVIDCSFSRRPDVKKVISACNSECCGFVLNCKMPVEIEMTEISIYYGDSYVISNGMSSYNMIPA